MKGRRRVERHVLMTVLSTLLPMILFGYVFYAATVEQTLSQAERRLRDHSKTYALILLERLQTSAAISARTPLQFPKSTLSFDPPTDRFVINENTYVPLGDLLWDLDTTSDHRCVVIDSEISRCSSSPSQEVEIIEQEWALFLGTTFDTTLNLTVRTIITKDQALEAIALVARLYPLLAILVSLLVGWVAYRQLRKRLEPLRQLQTATAAVSDGDYLANVDIRTGDEFESLGEAFNNMSKTLKRSFDRINRLAEIDKMILSAKDLDEIIRSTLEVAYQEISTPVEIVLWRTKPMPLVIHHRYDGITQSKKRINLGEFAPIANWCDVSLMQDVADQLCAIESPRFHAIYVDDALAGLLITAHDSSLEQRSSIKDFTDRLAVAITNAWRSEDLYKQAHYDRLTNLLNRPAFEDRLVYALAQAKRHGQYGALLFMDLDRFKQVNDTEGHKAGDRLLVITANRLKKSIREEDTLARFGGDEFGILISNFTNRNELVTLCERVIKNLNEPIVVNRIEHVVSASIGVAVFPTDADSSEELLMMADAAMYRAKAAGGATTSFYDKDMNEAAQQRVIVESRLRKALEDDRLCLYFQPKLDLASNKFIGAEGLMRWQDEQLGFVSPEEFIAIAEDTGMIHEFLDLCLSEAHRTLSQIHHTPDFRMAINVSPKQLAVTDFSTRFLDACARHSLAPGDLELEFTESVFASNPDSVIKELSIIRARGTLIALDDFGTGYSSLNLLRRLPIDVLKIDRSFIQDIETSNKAIDLVHHVVEIAKVLDQDVVAEGVETSGQLEILREIGCQFIQGYFIARPLPSHEFLAFLEQHQLETQRISAISGQ